MFRLGIDASGGDNGEIEVCKAVAKVAASDDTITFYVFGDKDVNANWALIQKFSKHVDDINKDVRVNYKKYYSMTKTRKKLVGYYHDLRSEIVNDVTNQLTLSPNLL